MRGFHVVLPTFAPDYSGAAGALYELGGVVVLHDPSGCLGNFVAYDEPRAYDARSRVFTSALDEMQALLGKDDALVFAACQAHEIAGGAFVAIVGTPNPMILGTDYRAIAALVEKRCGVPAFAVETTGLDTYETGAGKALLAYAKAVLDPAVREGAGGAPAWAPGRPRRANLLGAAPLDLQAQANADAAQRVLEDAGWEVASCWSMGALASPDALVDGAATAACNVLLTRSGLPLAKWMRRTYGIPFVWGRLSGVRGTRRCLREMEEAAAGRDVAPEAPHAGSGPRALVVSDQVLGASMRQALLDDRGYAHVDVACPFTCDRGALEPGDLALADEEELVGLVRSNAYDLVAGDPLLTGFADALTRARFAALPQAAISSRLHWNDAACPYGPGFLAAVDAARPAGERAGMGLAPDDALYDPRLFSQA